MTYDNLVFYRLKGEVTRQDIKEGIPKNCRTCPVAQAVSRMFPGYDVSVDSFRVILRKVVKGGVFTKFFTVSRKLRVWIGDYDHFHEVYGVRVGKPIRLIIRKDIEHQRDSDV